MEPTASSKSSTDPPGRAPSSERATHRIALGRVVGAHGLRGQIRIRYWGDDAGHLLEAPEVFVAPDPEAPPRRYDVEKASAGRRDEVRMKLAGVSRRELAEELAGRLVMIDRERLPSLPEDEYYGFELIGCRVELPDGRPLGSVQEIWSTGAADVLVVAGEDGAQHLIPVAESFVERIDLAGRRIVIDPIPGLLGPVPGEPAGGEPKA